MHRRQLTQLSRRRDTAQTQCGILVVQADDGGRAAMLTITSKAGEDLPELHNLTVDEYQQMKENLALKNFGMNLEEFAEAWKAGKFDDDREKHGDVIRLAMMLPEYWAE